MAKLTKNPVPLKYRFLKSYNGCPKQPDDFRDIALGDTPYAPDPNAPSWEQGFNNETEHGKLKREHQGSSLRCVGEGWSKYGEMLNLIETKEVIDLSAVDVYSQIFLPGGGAYIREGAKIMVNVGCSEESYLSSYPLSGMATEMFSRNRSRIRPGYEENRKIYKSKRFVHFDLPNPVGPRVINDEGWEIIRQIIWQFGGFVSGYKGHCMYVVGYGLVNGKKTIYFVNSYGEGSDRQWNEETSDSFYDVTFLYDMPNTPSKINMLEVIGDKRDKKQYLKGKDGKLRWIFNPTLLNELHSAGVINKSYVDWRENLDGLEIVDTWAVIK